MNGSAHEGARTLLNRHFLLYWLGAACIALGDAVVFIALPFLVLDITGDRAALATALLLTSLPAFAAPLIGLLADRFSLRLPLTTVTLLRALLFAALAFLASRGALDLGLIYAASLLNGSLAVFSYAATNVVLPHLVPAEGLARANSLLSGATMGFTFVGYGVAGALVPAATPAAALALAAPCFAVLALVLPWVALPPADPSRRLLGVVADLRTGARFVAQRSRLALLFLMVPVLYAAVGGLGVLMPAAMQDLGRGAAGYSLFSMLLAGGALAGVLSVTLLGSRLRPSVLIALGGALVALGFGVFVVEGFAASLAGAPVAGFGLGILEVSGVTLLQLVVPHGLRGKVIGLVLSLNGLGLSGGAWLAGRAESQGYYLAAAGLILLLSLLWVGANARRPLERPWTLPDGPW